MANDRTIFGAPTSAQEAFGARSVVDSRAVFGQTMGLVAVTVGFTALGAYVGKDSTRGLGLIAFVVALGCLFGLGAAARRNHALAVTLLFAVGLLLGVGLGPIINYYAQYNPSVVYRAAGSTTLFIGAFGAYGYATRRDLSGWARGLFWALLGLIAFGLVIWLLNIPGAQLIYAFLGLGIFAAYTMFDFNRLRRSGMQDSVLLAAGIFLDVINVFQFFLLIFGGGGSRR